MVALDVKWEGIPEMKRKFSAISDDLHGAEMRRVVIQGAKKFQDEWIAVAEMAYLPPPAGYSTGRYRRSIKIRDVETRGHEVSLKVSTDALSNQGAPYPYFLEYGTVKMAPKPSMRPAFDTVRGEVESIVRNGIHDLLNKHRR